MVGVPWVGVDSSMNLFFSFKMSVMAYFDTTEATAHVDSLLLRYLGRLKESEIEERVSLKWTEIQHC